MNISRQSCASTWRRTPCVLRIGEACYIGNFENRFGTCTNDARCRNGNFSRNIYPLRIQRYVASYCIRLTFGVTSSCTRRIGIPTVKHFASRSSKTICTQCYRSVVLSAGVTHSTTSAICIVCYGICVYRKVCHHVMVGSHGNGSWRTIHRFSINSPVLESITCSDIGSKRHFCTISIYAVG